MQGGELIKLQSINKSKLRLLSSSLFTRVRRFNPYKVAVFTGIVFLIGSAVDLYYEISFKKVLLMIRQITWQSNLYAFLLALFCLWKPNLLIFHSNYLFIGVASLLFTSSIIFLFALLPIFLNLNLIRQSATTPVALLIFWNIWNHVATPLSFFNLLVHRLTSHSQKWKITRKVAWFRYRFYWSIQLLGNVYFSLDPHQPSAYGAFSNWYWGKKESLTDKVPDLQQKPSVMLYNFQLSFFAFFIVMSVACISFFFLWHLFGPKSDRDNRPVKWLKLPAFI